MYRNSERFFDRVKAYQQGRAEVLREYEQAVAAAKPFEGSAYHAQALKEAQAKRDADLQAERRSTVAAMQHIFADMRTAVKNRPFVAPTAEAVNVLTVLRMMPNPDRATYTAAEAFLQDSPFALAALDQMAAEHNIHLAGPRQPSVESVLTTVDTMERAFYNALNDTSSSLHDYCPEDAAHCISRFAAIPYTGSTSSTAHPDTARIEALCAEINGPEVDA